MPHPEKRDLADTERRILAWLPRILPKGSSFVISNLRAPSSTGFSSDTLLFELAWGEQGARRREQAVMRLEPRGFNVFPSYDLALQHRTLRALQGSGVPVPEVLWVEEDPAPLGSPFYVMRMLEGWAPSDVPPMHQQGHFAELSPEERARVWWSGVEAMAAVHRVKVEGDAFAWVRDRHPGTTPLDRQLGYYEQFFDWGLGDRARYPILTAALDWLRRNAPADEPVRLCWGDSRLSNLLFRGTHCVAVLDWEMVFLGNPVQDLAWWNMADVCFTEGIGLPRLEGTPGHEETAARWAELTGLPLAALRYYEILALFRFGVIMARIGLQMKHYELIPRESDMDVQNLASLTLARRLVVAGL